MELLLTVCLALLEPIIPAGGVTHYDDHPNVGFLAGQVWGRIQYFGIREAMTKAEVEALLGRADVELDFGSGGCPICDWRWTGIRVDFTDWKVSQKSVAKLVPSARERLRLQLP